MSNSSQCDSCMNFYFDEEYDDYCCAIQCFDEDEVAASMYTKNYSCPYYRQGDEYTIVKKQN